MTNQPTFTKSEEVTARYENALLTVTVAPNGRIIAQGEITDGAKVTLSLADLKLTLEVLQAVYQDLYTPTSGL